MTKHPSRSSRKRGSALLLVVVLSIIAFAVVMAGLEESLYARRSTSGTERRLQVRYACETALAYYCDQIAYPQHATPPGAYSTAGLNGWLQAKVGGNTGKWIPLTPAMTPFLLKGSATGSGVVARPDIPVWVWVGRTPQASGTYYKLAAYAWYPSHPLGMSGTTNLPWQQPLRASGESTDQCLLMLDFRENQPFSNFLFFSQNQDLYLLEGSFGGSIFSNGRIHTPNAASPTIPTIAGSLKCASGFVDMNNASQGNSPNINNVSGLTPNGGAAAAAFPAANIGTDIYNLALKGQSGNDYTLRAGTTGAWANYDSAQPATIVVNNPPGGPMTLTITATDTGGLPIVVANVPYPGNPAVVYVDGNVTVNAPAGFQGQLTIASNSQLSVGTNIEYRNNDVTVPAANQTAFQLTGVGGPFTATNPPPGTDFSNYSYGANPTFDNGGRGSPTLGLMSRTDLRPAATAPPNLFINGSFFSQTGSPLNCNAYVGGQNLNIGGSLVGQNTVARTDQGHNWGFTTSGHYAFDNNARQNPPPGWLALGAPAFGATRGYNQPLVVRGLGSMDSDWDGSSSMSASTATPRPVVFLATGVSAALGEPLGQGPM